MSGVRFSFPACVVAGKGRIDRHDVLILRKYAFAEGVTNYDSARLMLALDDMCAMRCKEWDLYLVESLTAFLIDRTPPYGRIDEIKAAWLIRSLGLDGTVERPVQLELLLHILECASNHSPLLAAFALDQLSIAISDSPSGACHRMRPAQAEITAFDLDYIWRILRQSVQDGRLHLSQLESSVLHTIHNRVRGCDNHSGWNELMDHIAAAERPAIRLRSEPWLMPHRTGDAAETAMNDERNEMLLPVEMAMAIHRTEAAPMAAC